MTENMAKGVNVTLSNDTSDYWSTEKSVVVGMLATFGLLGCVGNTLVIIVFSKRKRVDKNTSSHFIIALAVTDLVACVIVIPSTIVMLYVNQYVENDILCKLYHFFETSVIPYSAFVMAAISVDRYLCICHPMKHLMTSSRAKILLIFLACAAGMMGIVVALLYGVYGYAYVAVGQNALNSIASNSSRTNVTMSKAPQEPLVVYTGRCGMNTLVFSVYFLLSYQRFHLSTYFVSVSIVAVLYTLIFTSVTKRRRASRARRKVTEYTVVRYTQPRPNSADQGVPAATDHMRRSTFHSEEAHNLQAETKRANDLPSPGGNQDGIRISPRSSLIPLPASSSTACATTSVAPKESSAMDRPSLAAGNGNTVDRLRQTIIESIADVKLAAMLFVVAVVFVLSYMPATLMIVGAIQSNDVGFYVYFVMNAANPLIYSFMNEKFRDDLRSLFSCCKC